jgi:TolB-like protein/DNA-binding winged helix-turn-helix (wHTH) protein
MANHSASKNLANGLRFGAFELDTVAGELYHQGKRLQVQEMPIRVLMVLLERPGELFRREELFERLWPDDELGVLDDNLNAAIHKLRVVLHDQAGHPSYIETVPRKGYRFVAPVFESPSPDDGMSRQASRAEMLSAVTSPHRLRWMGWAGILVIAVLLILTWLYVQDAEREISVGDSPPDAYTLAVLPFHDLGPEPDRLHFTDGITEDLLFHLGQVEDFRVVSRSSVMRYRDPDRDLQSIAKTLAATHFVEGSVRRAGNRLRISAQLIDARTGHHLWARQFDRELDDIFEVQSEIATEVSTELQAALPGSKPSRETVRIMPTEDVTAYQYYLQGRYLYNNYVQLDGAGALLRALEFFDLALDRDPEFARAWSGKAATLAMLSGTMFGRDQFDYDPDDIRGQIPDVAARALALDPGLGEPHAALGFARMFDLDWVDAEGHVLRAIELDPNIEGAQLLLGMILVSVGRSRDALDVMRTAVELNPADAMTAHWLSDALRNTGHLSESRTEAQRSVDLGMETSGIGVYLYHLLREDWEAAISYLSENILARGHSPDFVPVLVEAVRNHEAVTSAVGMIKEDLKFQQFAYLFDLSEPDPVFDAMEDMLDVGMGYLNFWRMWEPQLTHLRNHPRFHAIAERSGLLNYWQEVAWPDLCHPAEGGLVCD